MVRLFPATIELTTLALVIAVGIGIPLGYFAARRFGTWLDSTAIVGSLIGITIPVFFLGFLLKYVFAVKLGWLPADRAVRPAHPRRRASDRVLRARRDHHRQPRRVVGRDSST